MLCDTGMQLQHMAPIAALEKEQGSPGTKKTYLGSSQNPKERYRK